MVTATSASPHAHTMAAPVGRSITNEAHSPTRLAAAAIPQPTSSRDTHVFASITLHTAGTIRYANVSRTPATRTKNTTTTANAA